MDAEPGDVSDAVIPVGIREPGNVAVLDNDKRWPDPGLLAL